MTSMQRRIEVLFCDDIRTEITGKLLIIGTYFNDLVVNTFPANLNQFAFFAKLITPADRLFASAELRLEHEGNELFQVSIKAPPAEDILRDREKRPNGTVFTLPCVFQVQGLTVPGPGRLKLVVKFDDDDTVYSSLSLWARSMTDAPQTPVGP